MHTVTLTSLTHHYWRGVFIRAILAALFGLCALILPSISLATLLTLFGIFAIINGLLGIAAAFFERQIFPFWGIQLVAGIVSLFLGIGILIWPTSSILLAVWSLFTGIFQLTLAFGNRGVQPFWVPALTGAPLIALSIILFAANPVGALLTIVWVIGLYTFAYGGTLMWRAWYFHSPLWK